MASVISRVAPGNQVACTWEKDGKGINSAPFRVLSNRVLATCDIRQPELALENTSCCRLLLADPSEVEYNLRHYFAQLHIGVIDTVHGMLTVFKRVIGLSLQSLHYRFVTWSKPDTTSLLLGT